MNIINIAKARTTWSNAEFIVFKLSITCAYLIIGTYFHALNAKTPDDSRGRLCPEQEISRTGSLAI